MDDLKAIWQKVGDLKVEVGELIEMEKVETIYTQLKKEEDRQKKWMPWMIPYYIGMTLLLLWVYNWISWNWYDRTLTNLQIFATLLIPAGGFIMLYFHQLHKIPLDTNEHDRTSLAFLRTVKDKLGKKRKAVLLGNMIYTIILTIGLNIMSLDWGVDDLTLHWKPLLGINVTMLIICIYSFISTRKKIDKQYKDILARIDRFLAE